MPHGGTLKITRSVEELAKYVQDSKKSSSVIVGIDGFMGSGKSLLAMELAEKLNGVRISLDCYADPGSDNQNYVQKIKTEYLESDIAKLKAKFSYLVIEGICLAQVMKVVFANPDIRIYVKRISAQGLWHDGFDLEDYTDEAIKENGEGLHKSEFDYHTEALPHESADIIFERVDKNFHHEA